MAPVRGNNMRKSVFESKDTHSQFAMTADSEDKYLGPERRRVNRRATQDRRGEVRFDINASDRRENPGRRQDDVSVNFW
jgi:hypothetical protein